jgi:DNA-binding NarL/FixJ family response regulator
VHVVLATDATWLVEDVVAAIGGPETSFTVCADGRQVPGVVDDRARASEDVDIGIFDLQIGSMGGMAVTMALRLDESSGRLPHVPVLMLLDRLADVHLAKRSGADGWLVKPLDPLRLRRAVRRIVAGDVYREGLVDGRRGVEPTTALVAATDPSAATAEQPALAAEADVVPAPSR